MSPMIPVKVDHVKTVSVFIQVLRRRVTFPHSEMLELGSLYQVQKGGLLQWQKWS